MDTSPPQSSEVEAPPKRSRGRPRLYPVGDPRYAERDRKRFQRYRLANPRDRLVTASRGRAAATGIEHSITVEDIYWPTHCPVLGIELVYGTATMADRDQAPSLDRHDNDKGYIPGNVRVISYRANKLKNNGTPDELMAVARYAKYGAAPPELADIW